MQTDLLYSTAILEAIASYLKVKDCQIKSFGEWDKVYFVRFVVGRPTFVSKKVLKMKVNEPINLAGALGVDPVWVKRITAINRKHSDGYSLIGEWVNNFRGLAVQKPGVYVARYSVQEGWEAERMVGRTKQNKEPFQILESELEEYKSDPRFEVRPHVLTNQHVAFRIKKDGSVAILQKVGNEPDWAVQLWGALKGDKK